ncbi:predicted protein [Coccidioides posadasii str. Silveira]|uniref:Predicted protein n=2 Tax=Coccidioides posadasii TaxID=199306 RepID=E9CXV5_COCPS|nr:predicted protein [Coccidioides posadasii str. Silveira]KMM72660.1 hypothetical protein CPAG_08954 [Coccidioides posadasii RMSCC 3488]
MSSPPRFVQNGRPLGADSRLCSVIRVFHTFYVDRSTASRSLSAARAMSFLCKSNVSARRCSGQSVVPQPSVRLVSNIENDLIEPAGSQSITSLALILFSKSLAGINTYNGHLSGKALDYMSRLSDLGSIHMYRILSARRCPNKWSADPCGSAGS